ncbi:MAG: three-Cys-motif partner protein TcmP [Dehalococcoidia bacterium]|jgi:three-Cys-motif partner protein
MNELAGKRLKTIRKWNCHKLECFGDYIEAYTSALGKDGYCYLELYASGGGCIGKGTDCVIEDSALRALGTPKPFARHIFIARDPADAESLAWLMTQRHGDVKIVTGNCVNDKVLKQAFDFIPRSASSFAFIDPPGYRQLRWSTIRKLAAHGKDWRGRKTELLIAFPLEMALLRNLARPECQLSISRLYGNRDWQEISQKKQEGKIDADKMRTRLVRLFKAGLKELGYKYVEDLKPASPSAHPLYHVISASDSGRRTDMLQQAFGKARYLPCELLYTKKAT